MYSNAARLATYAVLIVIVLLIAPSGEMFAAAISGAVVLPLLLFSRARMHPGNVRFGQVALYWSLVGTVVSMGVFFLESAPSIVKTAVWAATGVSIASLIAYVLPNQGK